MSPATISWSMEGSVPGSVRAGVPGRVAGHRHRDLASGAPDLTPWADHMKVEASPALRRRAP